MGDGEAPVAQELRYLGSMLSKSFDDSVLPNPDACQIVPQETTTRHWLPNSEDARQIMPQEIAGSSHFRTRIAAPLGRPHWKALRLGRTPAPQLMGWGAAAGGGAAAAVRACAHTGVWRPPQHWLLVLLDRIVACCIPAQPVRLLLVAR